MKLDKRTAVVTGGARGIGLAIVKRYLNEGARVAIADIDSAAAEQAVAEIQADSRDAPVIAGCWSVMRTSCRTRPGN